MASGARVLAHGETNVGIKRGHNEDTFGVMDEDHLYIVCDGMGGHASGEVASHLSVDTLKEFFRATSADPEATWPYRMDKSLTYEENRFVSGVKLANLRIFEAAQRDPKLRGMGTTLVGIRVVEDGVLIVHVGDSRVYRLRDGVLTQLTEDHSLLNDYIKMKKLTEEEIANFPHKNVIVRALGMKDSVKVDIQLDVPQTGDLYILCSDGLCGPVTDPEIEQLSGATSDLKTICSSLIEKANSRGGPDNITVLAVRVMGVG